MTRRAHRQLDEKGRIMPGWYIHMESAKQMADRLRAGDIPNGLTMSAADAQALGELAHTWRNYLAAGAIGPDIFFLLPDYKGNVGNVLLTFVEWYREVWDVIDEDFMSAWEKWAEPAISGQGEVLNQITGGVLSELGDAMSSLTSAIKDAIIELLTKLFDWFGVLSSGVPQGFGDSAFFWSDIFHYRKTFEFAQKLFENATTDQHKAFALGWMAHCATDVTGHSFVNAKAGGPWRDHWQRHHLVENHMDALVYDSQHGGTEPYGEMDTSALHFRLAFRTGLIPPYAGADDAPAYDYFTGFPAYDTDQNATADASRDSFWDMDTADLPEDLCNLIIQTMTDVYGDAEPKILQWDPAEFRDGTSGRPSVESLQNTYSLLYDYVKMTTTSGYSPPPPVPPSLINDHNPPPFPGSGGPSTSGPDGGADDDDDDSFNLLDLILALFAVLAYIAELGLWLVTLPGAILADLATYPLRELLYEFAVVPLYNLYIAARKPLVMQGFLMPKHQEISRGLIELGITPGGGLESLAAALASPDGTGTAPITFDEPSGRTTPNTAYGADPAYPRNVIMDDETTIQSVLGAILIDPSCGQNTAPSEYLRPWAYPAMNNAGLVNGWEGHLSHPGPWVQGQDARELMNHQPGSAAARQAYEDADSPEATEKVSDQHLPHGEHFGDPVDFSVYVAAKLAGGEKMPDFNLDSDRGYGYHTWDWTRADSTSAPIVPDITSDSTFNQRYGFQQPCTPPQGYCQPGGPLYSALNDLSIHYLSTPDPHCTKAVPGKPGPYAVSQEETHQAGIPPQGGRKG
jgi:hypothetical protein